jgi:hypothetical protein
MWGLPNDLCPPVERALVKAEAQFREDIGRREGRTWPKIRGAIEVAMLASFEAWAAQACLAVQAGRLTVSGARDYADSFLQSRAAEIYEWLTPLLDGQYLPTCPYEFRRYDTEKWFVFSRDTADNVRHSDAWRRFLRSLAAPQVVNAAEGVKPATSFPHRAAWLECEMKTRDRMTRNRLHELSGLDSKTIGRILDGHFVSDTTLRKLADGLSFSPYPRVKPTDIPSD